MSMQVKMMDQSSLMTILGGLTERRGLRSRQRSFPARCEARPNDGAEDVETQEPAAALPAAKLPAGPWRSLGGYMDYSGWEDRERFLELDAAIARRREQEKERENREREMMRATASGSEWVDWRTLLRSGQDAA